jgi:hypothetical protein
MLMPLLAPGSAQASSSGLARQAAYPVLHVYGSSHFSGSASWLHGNNGQCTYVGDAWNDKVRSARTESNSRVEVWEHADCTGYALVVDRTGYGNIGTWVSAFRALS